MAEYTYFLFVFNDDSSYEMKCGVSFKDALWEMAKYTGCDNELFCKAIKGFAHDDVKGIIDLYDLFAFKRIEKVYIVDRELYKRANDG